MMPKQKHAARRSLTLKHVSIETLQPAPYNPRVVLKPGMVGYDKLRRSLSEFDLVQPPVWNRRTGHIVSGHQRVAILQADGVESLDVVVVDLPLEREQALNVTLNNAGVGGAWDTEKLLTVLVDLQELPDFDETLTGFSFDELRALLLAPDPEFDPDENLETKRGYRVTFEIPEANWEEFHPALDRLLATHAVTPHIQLPG